MLFKGVIVSNWCFLRAEGQFRVSRAWISKLENWYLASDSCVCKVGEYRVERERKRFSTGLSFLHTGRTRLVFQQQQDFSVEWHSKLSQVRGTVITDNRGGLGLN